MKLNFNYIFVLFCVGFSSKIYSQYISVDESYTAQYLIENVLINSNCATTSNWTLSGGNFGTNEVSFAYFEAAGTSFPFQNGIVLSTGKANNTIGPNSFLSDDGVGLDGMVMSIYKMLWV